MNAIITRNGLLAVHTDRRMEMATFKLPDPLEKYKGKGDPSALRHNFNLKGKHFK
jgi:hypothetical protein